MLTGRILSRIGAIEIKKISIIHSRENTKSRSHYRRFQYHHGTESRSLNILSHSSILEAAHHCCLLPCGFCYPTAANCINQPTESCRIRK